MYTVSVDHWLRSARRLPSPNASARRDPEEISLVVVHGISLPPGELGTEMVAALFTNTLDTTLDPSLADLDGVRVSSHLLISRRGRLSQFVAFDRCAWHAGVSSHRGRERCNDYSIGIELIGTDDRPYTTSQYDALAGVLAALMRRYPRLSLADVVGHAEIAPGRKTDPGPAFDWPRLFRAMAQ